ncbi:hypothetical protein ABWK22_02870 [Gottfriedia acidiceleris]|uniref:hypothetical protein n=1 Tax=Gottfriedia acidiceleris TaxID=371036 RepID=UPI003390A112
MERISKTVIEKFKYDSEEERTSHVKEMEDQGYECSGQRRKSDDSLLDDNRKFYWYGEFMKRIN